MKKLIITAMLLFAATAAFAQGPTIGIYEDVDYTICYGDIEVFVQKSVYVVAWMPPDIVGLTAVEFRVDNLPLAGADGIITPTWNSDLVIGDLDSDISIAFPEPQPGPYALIGTLGFLMITDTWLPADHVMTVMPGMICDCLVVVDDNFIEHDAEGGMYTFNCSDPNACECFGGTPTENTNWGTVKALY